MLSEELKKRISELNRKEMRVFPLSEANRMKKEDVKDEKNVGFQLEKFLKGEVIHNDFGCFLKISKRLGELINHSEQFTSNYKFTFKTGGYDGNLDMLHQDLRKFFEVDCEEALFIDLETCGLISSPIFLVGLMHFENDDFSLEQLFARDYTEEKPLLAYLEDLMKRFKLIVSFNGKAFDYPYLMERGFLYNIRFDPYFPHFDILSESRRRWKEYLPDCKLKTIEQNILRRRRINDIPGNEIPDVYHEFVRTGNFTRIKSILNHNLLDLVTMGELVLYMFTGSAGNL
jgi:uncharacterized protein YprB with RNaseH-like and TPR domain